MKNFRNRFVRFLRMPLAKLNYLLEYFRGDIRSTAELRQMELRIFQDIKNHSSVDDKESLQVDYIREKVIAWVLKKSSSLYY